MNILIFSDLHINKNELQECSVVLDEIIEICNVNNIEQVISLGDTFDKINPESECLDLLANFIIKLNRPMIIIAAQSHESTTPEESILNHFGLLNNNIKVVKEYIDTTHMLCGHFVLNESKINYDAKKSKNDFVAYKYVFLGHQHTFEIIKPNICQLGSCRYVDFSEVDDFKKVICIIEDYQKDTEKTHFLGLKSPYPIKDIHLRQIYDKNTPKSPLQGTISEEDSRQIASSAQIVKSAGANPLNPGVSVAIGIQVLDKLDPKTKVRVIFHDFDSYTQFINKYDFYKNKFVLFKDKKEFIISDNTHLRGLTEMKSLKEVMEDYLVKTKVNDIIKRVLLEELNEK